MACFWLDYSEILQTCRVWTLSLSASMASQLSPCFPNLRLYITAVWEAASTILFTPKRLITLERLERLDFQLTCNLAARRIPRVLSRYCCHPRCLYVADLTHVIYRTAHSLAIGYTCLGITRRFSSYVVKTSQASLSHHSRRPLLGRLRF